MGASSLMKSKVKKKQESRDDINLIEALDMELPGIFAPPKDRRSLLRPRNRGPCNVTLPEDCHYRAENLVKLLLHPDVMVSTETTCSSTPQFFLDCEFSYTLQCLGKKRRKSSGDLITFHKPRVMSAVIK